MLNPFDPMLPDPLAGLFKEPCGSLIVQPMPERDGDLRLGGDCGCGCVTGGQSLEPHSYAPPDDGENGVEDSFLCR